MKSGAKNALESKVAGGVFTDKRDGKKYRTVKIGNQTWMAENLNYNASGSKCYENNSGNCAKYGRLHELKAKSGWNKNGNGTDEFGFSALPDGYSGGNFGSVGDYGWYMTYNCDCVYWDSFGKSILFSVRCLKD